MRRPAAASVEAAASRPAAISANPSSFMCCSMQTMPARIAYPSEASVNARRKKAAPEEAAFFPASSLEADPNTAMPIAVAFVLTPLVMLFLTPLPTVRVYVQPELGLVIHLPFDVPAVALVVADDLG